MSESMTAQEARKIIISLLNTRRSRIELYANEKDALGLAITALQEQVPRVLTLDGMRSIPKGTPVWLESYEDRFTHERDYYVTICLIDRFDTSGDYPWGVKGNYRLWAGKKPTKQQMVSTPWEVST